NGPSYTTRLNDQQIAALINEGRQKLNAQLADLARFFTPGSLRYGSAADEFVGEVVRSTEEARNYFLSAAIFHPDKPQAVQGLLEAMELLAQRWVVRGNEELVKALYNRYQQPGLDLFQVNQGLRNADQNFLNGVGTYSASAYARRWRAARCRRNA